MTLVDNVKKIGFWWKLYFWLITSSIIIGYITGIFTYAASTSDRLLVLFDTLLSLPAYIAFIGFVFGKKFIDQRFAQFYVPVFFAWEIFGKTWLYPLFFNMPVYLTAPDLVINLPMYAAIALYAFKKDATGSEVVHSSAQHS